MEKLDFSKAAAPAVQTNGPSKIRPGIHENVVINGIQVIQPDGVTVTGSPKSPYMEIHFVDGVNGNEMKEKLYMSSSALPYTLAKLSELITATGQQVPEEASVENIQALLLGRSIALRTNGEEVRLNDGKVIITTTLSSSPFCAPAGKGVATLRWDETKNIKRLPVTAATASTQPMGDLPFPG